MHGCLTLIWQAATISMSIESLGQGQNLMEASQNASHNIQKSCSAANPIQHKCESIQGATVMAPRFLQDLPKTSIPTRAQIQEESEVKVGATEVDQSCQDCADELYNMWVALGWMPITVLTGNYSRCGVWSVVFGLEQSRKSG